MLKRRWNLKWVRCSKRLPLFRIIALFTIVLYLKTISSKKPEIYLQQKPITDDEKRLNSTKILTLRGWKIQREERGIPKIIHQIWNTDDIPEAFHDNIRGLVAHNNPPRWIYFFWTLAHGEKLIANEFPQLLLRYTKAGNLLKADILRLVVLYRYGGVYFDLDTVSVKPLDHFVETHNCSFVTEPKEHLLEYKRRTNPTLLITNAAMLCKPMNWFLAYLLERLANQSPQCRGAIYCTGPAFVSRHYIDFQGTNRSRYLPIIDDFSYFEDKVDKIRYKELNETCVEPFPKLKHEWSRDICLEWIKRGRDKRNISEKAYTYHTWFHTYMNPQKLRVGKTKNIKELESGVTFYQG